MNINYGLLPPMEAPKKGPDGENHSVNLFDAFLNPGNDGQFTLTLEQLKAFGYVPQPGYAQIGTNSIVAGILSKMISSAGFA